MTSAHNKRIQLALLTSRQFVRVLEEGCRTYGARDHRELVPSPPEDGGLD